MLLVIPFLSFLAGLLSAHLLMRAGRTEALRALAALFCAAGAWALWREGTVIGLDVFVYTFAFWGAVLPGLVALAPGAALGWMARATRA